MLDTKKRARRRRNSTKIGRNVVMMREDSLILPSTALERVKETNDLFRDI